MLPACPLGSELVEQSELAGLALVAWMESALADSSRLLNAWHSICLSATLVYTTQPLPNFSDASVTLMKLRCGSGSRVPYGTFSSVWTCSTSLVLFGLVLEPLPPKPVYLDNPTSEVRHSAAAWQQPVCVGLLQAGVVAGASRSPRRGGCLEPARRAVWCESALCANRPARAARRCQQRLSENLTWIRHAAQATASVLVAPSR